MNGNGSLIYYYYDADGQPTYTISGGGVRTDYTFDFDGQMTSLSKPGVATRFQYDALGRQINRFVNGAATNYYYDGGSVLFETNGSVETAVYTWGNGLIRRNGEYPLSDGRGTERQETGGGRSARRRTGDGAPGDGRGTERQETDGGRNVTATLATDASGMTVASSGSSGSAYGFQGGSGYRSDGDGPAGFTAFQKVGARYYDPLFGRFITRDTDLSQKPYAYCGGDPVNNTDPTGHDVNDDIKMKLLEQEVAAAFNEAMAALAASFAATSSTSSVLDNISADPSAGTLGASFGSINGGIGGLNGVGSPSGTVGGTATVGSATVTGGVTATSGAGLSYNAGANVTFGRGFNFGYGAGGMFTLDYTFNLNRNSPTDH